MKEEYYDLFPNLRGIQDSLETTTSEMDALRAKLEAEREKTRALSEALEWYANLENWDSRGAAGDYHPMKVRHQQPDGKWSTLTHWVEDWGDRARRALGRE